MADDGLLLELVFARGPLGFVLSKDGRGCAVKDIYPPGHTLSNAQATAQLAVGYTLVKVAGQRVVKDKSLISAQIKGARRPLTLTFTTGSPRAAAATLPAALAQPGATPAPGYDSDDSDDEALWQRIAGDRPSPRAAPAASAEGSPRQGSDEGVRHRISCVSL